MDSGDIYAVVMAGGKGERFWPQSRVSHPKQLLRLIGNLTLIEQTVERILPIVKSENIFVITNEDYKAPMKSLLSMLPPENILGEPSGKDTAPCVALASALVKAKANGRKAVMMVLPADQIIKKTEEMHKVLIDCCELASKGKAVTIGVAPTFPSTGYGYIHCGQKISSGTGTVFYNSLGFKEKPDIEMANKFLEEKCYKWNSGIFVWSLDTILAAFEKYAPELSHAVQVFSAAAQDAKLDQILATEYVKFPRISIDYAVMEKMDNESVVVADCTFDWDDVGSWTALRNQIRPGENNNVTRGLSETLGTKNCIVVTDAKHLVATVDVEDLIIVHTDDATLVCNAKSAQKIKELVQQISSKPELSKYI